MTTSWSSTTTSSSKISELASIRAAKRKHAAIDPGPRAEHERVIVPAVTGRKPREHWNPDLEQALADRVSGSNSSAGSAFRELTQNDACHSVERARPDQGRQHSIDTVCAFGHVFEKQHSSVGDEQPALGREREEHGEISAEQNPFGPTRFPCLQVGEPTLRTGIFQRRDDLGAAVRVSAAESAAIVCVQRCDPESRAFHVKRGHVGKTDDPTRRSSQAAKVDRVDDARQPVSAPSRDNGLGALLGQGVLELGLAASIGSREVAVPTEQRPVESNVVARAEKRDPRQTQGAIERPARRHDADWVVGGKWPREMHEPDFGCEEGGVKLPRPWTGDFIRVATVREKTALARLSDVATDDVLPFASRLWGGARRSVDEMVTRVLGPDFEERARIVAGRYTRTGGDPFGFDLEAAKYALMVCAFFYRAYFRAEVYGIEHVPSEGRALLVANHSGQVPIDGAMIGSAVFLEADPPRFIRAMVEKWSQTLPFVSTFFSRVGQVVGVPDERSPPTRHG